MESGEDPLPVDGSIGRVALVVEDLDRLRSFYEDVVGLTTLDRRGDGIHLGTAGAELLVLEARPDRPARTAAETGLFHLALRVPSREALGDALARIENEWELTGASDHLVSEALYLRDPAGNGLEVYYDRPRADWPDEDDGSAGMDTRPLALDGLRDLGTDTGTVPDGTTVGHVHLEVSDLGETAEWYTRGLGMGVRQRYGTSAVFLAFGDYHHHVGANVWNGRTEPGDGLGLDWFEVRVPDERAATAVESRLRSLGAGPTVVDGGFSVRDPDEIEVRVVVGD